MAYFDKYGVEFSDDKERLIRSTWCLSRYHYYQRMFLRTQKERGDL